MIPSKFIIQGRSNNRSSTGNSKHKNLMCNYYHKKGHIRADCCLRKKKQPMLMSLNWLKRMKISVMFYLLQIEQLVIKIDGLLTLDVHSTSVPIRRYSLHTFRFKWRSLHGEVCYKQGDWRRNNPVSVS